MKFGNGCWLLKEGYECFAPQQIYFVTKEEKKVTILATTAKIVTRGDTLGGITLRLVITSPAPEVIRVQTSHHIGGRGRKPEFDLNTGDGYKLNIREDEEKIQISSGSLLLTLTKNPWTMTYERNGEVLAKSGGRDFGYMKTDWRGFAYDRGSGDSYMRQQLSLSVGELVYGFGERFTPFVKNGQSIEIWNEDGGTSTEQSYKNIPFYLTNRGYGVFVNHPEKVEFEVATEQVSKVEFSVPGEELDYFFINGPSMKKVVGRYTDLTGKPALPAQWTFGLWLSTSFTTDYDEKTVMSFIDGMEERGIPLSVFHFDCFWMKDFQWCNFAWDERVFPDPVGMIERIKERGIKVCVWINPYIAQESELFLEGMEKGYFIQRKNGDVWQWDMWQPGMAIVDFTNPEARSWYQSKLKLLLDMGVDCFKTDFGERIPTENIAYYDGSDPLKMHNYYTYLYNKTVYEILEQEKGKEEAILFARSATVGGQKFPVHWGGDCWSNYEAMAESLRGGLSLTMSGFGYWSHDMGGFESTSTPDVYKRWIAFGLLSTHSRLHGSTSYRVPWLYDEESVEVLRYFTKLKLSLMPYLLSEAFLTSTTGIPMMRSMVLEFDKDYTCRYLDRQYMLGEKLLVSPIFNEEGMAEYYLPAGKWTNYFTGEKSNGAVWRTEHHDYLSIPLWVRENTILPICETTKRATDSYRENLLFKIYELQEEASTEVYENGEKVFSITVREEKDRVHIYADSRDSKCSYQLCFVNCRFEMAENADISFDGESTTVTVENPEVEIICR